ncbi:MAG: TatD DNase family protein [Chloroflexia bacterium]|jgi:TatD DNase family protein|nr:TatD DNase family protein [Chloroflexia bacterium]
MHSADPSRLPLVDSHAHLDSPDFAGDTDELVSRAREKGLVGIVSIGFEPDGWQATLQLAERYEMVFPAIGIHPNSADQASEASLSELESLCRRHKVVGLGETGLDYYREYVSHEQQRESFQAHLDLARQLDLPVIIHNRDAHADILDILKRDGQGTRGVMHSFSGDVAYAEECMALGYMISLAGPVTFKKAVDKHEVAAAVPLDMLLVETDCPYLTPEPFRGRRNEPSYVYYTAEAIARIRGVPFEVLAEATTANAARLFGLPIGFEQTAKWQPRQTAIEAQP